MLPAEQSAEEKPEADLEDNKKEEPSKIDITTLIIILILVLIVIMCVLMFYTMKTMKQIAPQAWQMQQPPQLLPPPNHTMNQNMNRFDQNPYDGTPRQQ